MLSDIVSESPELIEIVTSTPDDTSENDPNQNVKTGSFTNLKNQITRLQIKQKKMILATLILLVLFSDLLYKILTDKKGI